MIYLPNYKKNEYKFDHKILIFLIFIISIFVLTRASFVKNFFVEISNSTIIKSSKIVQILNIIPKWFENKNKIIRQNEELEKENYILKLEKIDNLAIHYENKKLRQEIGAKPHQKTVRASVITKPFIKNFDSFVINQGAEDGISSGDIVVISDRILAGRVVEANKNSSIVMTDSFPENSIFASLDTTGDSFEIKGVGGGNLKAKIPSSTNIKEGDNLIISYNTNYIVAIVGAIKIDESMGLKEVFMTLPFDINKIDSVFVITEI